MSDSGESHSGPPLEAQQQQQQPELGDTGENDIPGPLQGVLRDPEERETIDAATVRRRMTEMSPEERADMAKFARLMLETSEEVRLAEDTVRAAVGAEVQDGVDSPAAPPTDHLSTLFTREVDKTDDQIKTVSKKLPKQDRGEKGSKLGNIHEEWATKGLETKFDLMSHQHKYSTGGDTSGRSVNQSMRTQLTAFMQLLRNTKQHLRDYDLLEVTVILDLLSPTITKPAYS